MSDLQFTIKIKAPKNKVWDIMLADKTYRIWTAEFNPGSYYRGSWEEGSDIDFVGPDAETESESGMFAKIVENRQYEFISIKHLGQFSNGEREYYNGDGFENYTFTEVDGTTELVIDMLGIPDDFVEMFSESWPRALNKLKEIIETA